LRCAEVVLHDALVAAEILALVSQHARVINVGKRCGQKCITQGEINDLLVRLASAGKAVVRLKSGDPSIFGRAAEELDALREAGIEVEIVPGITASLAAAARIGISLTDRRRADQLLFISAHRGHGKQNSDWQGLVSKRTTVVVYMPGKYDGVAEDLRRAGLSEATPCAVVSNVSTPDERWYQTTLGSLNDAPSLGSPCVLIVGEAVRTKMSEVFRADILQRFAFHGDLRMPSSLPTEL
jgi:uroporphyrin-III C-methyltransferase